MKAVEMWSMVQPNGMTAEDMLVAMHDALEEKVANPCPSASGIALATWAAVLGGPLAKPAQACLERTRAPRVLQYPLPGSSASAADVWSFELSNGLTAEQNLVEIAAMLNAVALATCPTAAAAATAVWAASLGPIAAGVRLVDLSGATPAAAGTRLSSIAAGANAWAMMVDRSGLPYATASTHLTYEPSAGGSGAPIAGFIVNTGTLLTR